MYDVGNIRKTTKIATSNVIFSRTADRIAAKFSSSFLPVGHPAGLDGFVGCIDLTYLRDSLTNIRIRVLLPGRPSFRENAS